MAKRNWREVAKAAQDFRDDSIKGVEPPVPEISLYLPRNLTSIPRELLAQDEVLITETSPEELVKSLASGKLNSTTVVNAFLRRAGLAQKLVLTLKRPTIIGTSLTFYF